MKNRASVLILCLSMWGGALWAQQQKMSESEISAFKQLVILASQKVKTLSTDFVQYKHMSFLSKEIVSSGKMRFKEPGLLQWQYKDPFSYTIVFRNGQILINDEGKKNKVDIGSSEIFKRISKLIVGSVNGNLFDDKDISFTYAKVKDQTIATLIPKDEAMKRYIKQMELTFDKDAIVTQVRLLESSEDYTRIVFKNKMLNEKIDDSVFDN